MHVKQLKPRAADLAGWYVLKEDGTVVASPLDNEAEAEDELKSLEKGRKTELGLRP